MVRNIFVVNAMIVDANGAFAQLSGYPKSFDSHNYNDDVDKAQKRAEGEFHDACSAMCKRDDRQLQTAMMMSADGFILMNKSYGRIADLPDPEPEPDSQREKRLGNRALFCVPAIIREASVQ